MANLRLVPATGEAVEITKDDALVGRDPGCDIVLADGSVSRRHSRIQKRGLDWAVVDQGSANGTFVDSQRVAEATLKNGQELRFGAVAYKVELEEEDLGATVAGIPAIGDDATVVSTTADVLKPKAPAPPPLPPPVASPPPPPLPPPMRPPAPPAPPSAAAAKERFKPPPAAGAAPPPVPQMSAGPAPAKKGKGPVFWIFAGCCGCILLGLILGALFGGGLYFMTAAPVAAVREQLVALKAKDDVKACSYLAASSSLDCDRLKELAVEHPGLGDNKDSTFINRSVNGDQATLTGALVSESGQAEPVIYTLTKEAGAWKVVGVSFEVPGSH
jgi:hypothetical protein